MVKALQYDALKAKFDTLHSKFEDLTKVVVGKEVSGFSTEEEATSFLPPAWATSTPLVPRAAKGEKGEEEASQPPYPYPYPPYPMYMPYPGYPPYPPPSSEAKGAPAPTLAYPPPPHSP